MLSAGKQTERDDQVDEGSDSALAQGLLRSEPVFVNGNPNETHRNGETQPDPGDGQLGDAQVSETH